jgi:hypothetical protein
MSEKINQYLIQLIMLTSPVLAGLGIDTYQLKVILQTKCRLDDRRSKATGMYGKTSSSAGWMRNVFFFVLGLLFSSIFFAANIMMAQTLYLTTVMIYAVSVLITDFSNVLIDVRDHYFIVSRPVNDKTVAAARTFHILLYLSKIFIPFYLPGILVMFLKNGVLPGLIFLFEIASATAMCVFAVNIIYMVMLRLMKPQRFRDIIAYFQIAFSIIIFGSYIIFPQFLNLEAFQTINPLDYTVSYFFPPVWLASLQNWTTGHFGFLTYIFTALSLFVPILCLAGVSNFLSSGYNNRLSRMGAASTNKNAEKDRAYNTNSLSSRLAPLFTFSPLEQLGFKITWKLSSRLNKFKSRVYPSFAFIVIYFFYWAFINGNNMNGNDQSFIETWQHLPQTAFYLFLLYAIGYMAIIIVMQITYSEKAKAAWFYQMSSTEKPGIILLGMIKSICVKYLLPSTIAALIFIFAIWGPGIWLNVLFALINILLITIIIALIKGRKFPFSMQVNLNQQRGKRFLNIFLILIPLVLGFFQSYIAEYTYVIIGLSILYASITWALFRVYKNISWSELLEK